MHESNDILKNSFAPFRQKMEEDGANDLIIRSFYRSYALLHSGDSGKLTTSQISPVDAVPSLEDLTTAPENDAILASVAIIKLNGGLGTSMGLDKAKSVIPVREGLHFIDIIARQVLTLEKTGGIRIPIIFMNSFNTHEDTLDALKPYSELRSDIPFDFLQNKVPKVLTDNLSPAQSLHNPELEWCPPGHGDIYIAMQSSGVLDALMANGFEYVFISNADNLGAVVDGRIPAFMRERGTSFLMEVAQRTSADRKGGHLARLANGRLALREVAQCPNGELDEFQNISLYKFFNTNSIWVHLPSLAALLREHNGVPPMPLIRNEKSLDPRDASTPKVYQLETAMGAAISLFENSEALLVPRTRFAPVKTTDDLLAVRSDAYVLTDAYQIIPNPERTGAVPTVALDKKHYKHVDQLEAAFPHGSPSLLRCNSVQITGKYVFGRDVVLQGNVTLENHSDYPETVADSAILGDI